MCTVPVQSRSTEDLNTWQHLPSHSTPNVTSTQLPLMQKAKRALEASFLRRGGLPPFPHLQNTGGWHGKSLGLSFQFPSSAALQESSSADREKQGMSGESMNLRFKS